MIYLETSRVSLREITREDAPLLLDLDSDPEVMTYLTDGRPSSLDEINRAINRITDLYSRYNGRFGVWAAIERSSGDFMGWFLLRPGKKDPDNLKSIELGYRLKKKFWGQGIAPEVSIALMSKGLNQLKAETIWATTMEKNHKSRRVMEKIGLHFECSFIEDEFPGTDKNAVRYSLKR